MNNLPRSLARTLFPSRKLFFRGAISMWLVLFSSLSAFTPIIAFAQTSDTGAVQVTASVLPSVGDFEWSFASPTAGPIHQSETSTYQITYGTHAYHATAFTITAKWEQGTIAGQQTATVDTLEYVSGSATAGYGGAPAVIDTTHRTITWHIANVPANTTGQSLSFQLRAIPNYIGDQIVTIPVAISAEVDSTTLTDQSISTEYTYSAETSASPTPTPTPSESSTSSPTPTPTPTATPAPLSFFGNLTLTSKDSSQLSLVITTTQATTLSVRSGTTLDRLTEVQSLSSLSRRHTVVLEGLTPEMTYYLQFRATNASGISELSDIYAFTTAKKTLESAASIDKSSLVLTSGQTLMVGSALDPNNIADFKITLPVQKSFEFSFVMTQGKKLQKVEVWIENTVLGISTLMQKPTEPNTIKVDVVELLPGRYQGRLLTPTEPGEYRLHARIFDTEGNVIEQSLGAIRAVPRLKAVDGHSGKPIESAQLVFWYWRSSVALFDPLPVEFFGLSNPLYTDPHGESPLALPLGKYRVRVTALGYEEQEMDFSVGGAGENYPIVALKKQPGSFLTSLHYYSTIIWDVGADTKIYITNLAESARYFELNALTSTAFFIFLLILTIAGYVHVPVSQILRYVWLHKTIFALRNKLGDKIHGRVFDDLTNSPLPKATVYLIDRSKRKVIASQETDLHGDFTFLETNEVNYDLQVICVGYEPITFRQSNFEEIGLGGYLLTIQPRHKGVKIIEQLKNYFRTAVGFILSSFLVFSLLGQIVISQVLGIEKSWLFLFFSIMNILIWIWHVAHRHADRNVY